MQMITSHAMGLSKRLICRYFPHCRSTVRVVLVRMGAFMNSLRLVFLELSFECLKYAINYSVPVLSETAQHCNISTVCCYSLVTNDITNILIHKIFLQLLRNVFITLITEVARRLILEATITNFVSTR